MSGKQRSTRTGPLRWLLRAGWHTLSTGALLAALALLAVLLLPSATGYTTLVVQTGSMTGTADIGSLVVGRPLEAGDTRVGDIILIPRENEDGTPKTPVLHRIIERQVVNGRIVVRTKGDANEAADPTPLVLDHPTVTPVLVLPHVGRLAAKLQSPVGWFGLVVFPATILVAYKLVRLWDSDGDPDRSAADVPASFVL